MWAAAQYMKYGIGGGDGIPARCEDGGWGKHKALTFQIAARTHGQTLENMGGGA
jgi:hypothetical protein